MENNFNGEMHRCPDCRIMFVGQCCPNCAAGI